MDSLSVMGNTSNEMLQKHYIKSDTMDLHDKVYDNYYKKKYGSKNWAVLNHYFKGSV